MNKALTVLLELKESASYWSDYDVPIGIHERIEEAILELTAQPEPVAWIIETEIHGKLSEWVCTDKKHYMEEHDSIKEPIPLYTAPPKREPFAYNAVPNDHSDSVSDFNPVSNNYWDR